MCLLNCHPAVVLSICGYQSPDAFNFFPWSQGLAAFLKAIGYLIPLMDAEYANYYTREVMLILIREFQSPDEEMKKIVLKVSWNSSTFMTHCSEVQCSE